jgi:thioesterase domain-containing protein
MPDAPAKLTTAQLAPELQELQAVLESEIPMCSQMGITVHECGPEGLVMRMPLAPNRNHQRTAFAGSLNAVCTIAGWGTMYLLMKELDRAGSTVIRRSAIKYHEPVISTDIYARCLPVTPGARQYFLEMLDEKKQAKMDLAVEIAGSQGPSVVFGGSYVVIQNGATEF